MEDIQIQLNRWAVLAQQALCGYSACFRAFYQGRDRFPQNIEFSLGQLHIRANSTSETAMFITTHLKFWDAEILLRSVMEATVKFVFICVGKGEELARRADEFLNVLPEIARLRRHRRAEEFLARVPNRDDLRWRPLRDLLLTETEVQSLTARFPKDVRSRLEGKWGFTQIAESLTKTGGRFSNLTGLLYPYGMQSHNVHQDGDAIRVMWEREQREPERERALELAHGARVIGDVMTYASVRALAAYTAYNLDPKPIHEVMRQFKPLSAELGRAADAWHAVEYGPGPAGGPLSADRGGTT